MIIQVLLIAATLAIAWYALREVDGRRLGVRRLVGSAVALAGVLAVLWPDALTWVANLVGVRRGTDLVLYALVVTTGFVASSLYLRLRRVEQEVTVLVRELALLAQVPAPTPDPRTTDA